MADLTTLANVKAYLNASGIGATLGTPVISGGQVTSIPVINGGAGYQTAPAILISGDGIGALATATVSSGSIVQPITVTVHGSGYTTATAQVVMADDPLLSRLIAAASSHIIQLLGRNITVTNDTETRNGNGNTKMVMQDDPIISVSSVIIDGNTISPSVNGAWGYLFSDTTVYLIGYRFCHGVMNVTIAYQAGYATVPAWIEQACIDLVALKYKERDRIGLNSKSLATETITYKTADLTKDQRSQLQQFAKVAPIVGGTFTQS